MKRTLDINELRRKRQLNVQEQNALEQDRIYTAAFRFRSNLTDVPLPIREFLVARGIDLRTAIDVDFEDMSMLGLSGLYRGLVVTADKRFWRWELSLNAIRSAIDSVDEWSDVTSEYPVSEHAPGTGKSYGFMCLAVLAKLNATQQSVQPDRREDAAPG